MPAPVTIVTSTYNWPHALRQAIRTALAQSFTDFEYLIVGDGCTDETQDVVRAFDDPRIVWRNLPANLGNQSDVNRLALEWARGEYIAYLNHDDLWFPDHLERLLPAVRDNRLDIANSLCIVVSAPGYHQRQILGLPQPQPDGSHGPSSMTTTVMHTAQAAQKAGSWTPWRELSQPPTLEFFDRLRRGGPFGVLPHVTALKFHSANRLDSYRKKDASEQERWAGLIESDPDLRYNETMTALACASLHESIPVLAQPPKPPNAPPGWQIEQWRRMRGLPAQMSLGSTEPGEIAPLPPQQPSYVRLDDAGRSMIASTFRIDHPR